jgi:hypothetical protein
LALVYILFIVRGTVKKTLDLMITLLVSEDFPHYLILIAIANVNVALLSFTEDLGHSSRYDGLFSTVAVSWQLCRGGRWRWMLSLTIAVGFSL